MNNEALKAIVNVFTPLSFVDADFSLTGHVQGTKRFKSGSSVKCRKLSSKLTWAGTGSALVGFRHVVTLQRQLLYD